MPKQHSSQHRLSSRRHFLLKSAFSFGSLPMTSLVTGLPVSFLASISAPARAQSFGYSTLILSHMQGADPINTNVPGTYPAIDNDINDPLSRIEHPQIAELGAQAEAFEKPVTFSLGSQQVKAAGAWASLPEDLRERLGFWHHATFTNAHPDFSSVRKLNGAATLENSDDTEELGTILANTLAPHLSTTNQSPVSLGGTRVSAEGMEIPIIKPLDIKNMFASSVPDIDKMIRLRDRFIDKAYQSVKENGTPAQLKFLNNYATTREEANAFGDSLGQNITDVDGNGAVNQARMAVALTQINFAPVITIGLPFGGDNHGDSTLLDEVTETLESIETLKVLWQKIKAANLEDTVTFASLNTFGRDLIRNGSGGRDHNGEHHCMFAFGPTIKAGVVGGLEERIVNNKAKDFKATGFNSQTGLNAGTIDIPYEETLVSVAKTLSKAVGLEDVTIADRFEGGRVISAALKT